MKKYEKLLKNLGMNDYEIVIYLSLIEHGPMHISAIAEIIGHHRPLVTRGSNDSKVMDISPKLGAHEASEHSIKSLLRRSSYHEPQRSRNKRNRSSPNSRRSTRRRSINPNSRSKNESMPSDRSIVILFIHFQNEVYIIGIVHPIENLQQGASMYRMTILRCKRKRNSNDTLSRVRSVANYAEGDPYREVVSIPKGFDPFNDNISKLIYGNKVAIIDYDTQLGWVIESERFARYEEKIFKLLFRALKTKI